MKNIISILTLTFLTVTINAQSLIPMKYGVKVGSNISNATSNSNDGVKNVEISGIVGISGGFYMEIALNEKWYINPDLLYVQKGVKFDYDFTHDYEFNSGERDEHNTTNELKLAYIELNPTISYKANSKLSLNFGPSLSFLIQSEYSANETNNSEIPEHEELDESVYSEESLDVGLNIGISYYLSENFLIDGKVNTGFMSLGTVVKEINTGGSGNDPKENIFDFKNNGIVFSVAYLF